MLPKEELYGAPDTWIYAPVVEGRNAGCKIAAWQTIGNAILGWGANPPVLALNEQIDNSISFCGIANDSPISSVFIINYSNHSLVNTITPPKTDWCLSYYDSRYTVYNNPYYYDTDADDVLLTPITQLGDTNKHRFLRPIVDIDPAECILLVTIEALNADGTGNWNGSIEDYETTYKNSFPNVIAIYVTPYSRQQSDDAIRAPWTFSNDYTGGYISRLIEYPITDPEWGNVVNYCAPNPESTLGGNNRFVVWGGKENSGIFPAIGGVDDTIDDTLHRLTHEYSREWLLRCVASLGLFFAIDEFTAQNGALDNPKMYCGTIDGDGLTHGDYTQGAANREQAQYNWTSTAQESTYDPTKNVDPNIYNNTTVFNYIGGLSSMLKRYVLNGRGVESLGRDLFKIGDDIVAGESGYVDYDNIILNNFLTNNPIDAIVSLKKYPVKNIPHIGTTPERLKLGKVEINTTGFVMPYTSFMYLFKPIPVYPRFGNCFLDYAPYTTYDLYIPFCGTVQLDPNDIVGHNIDVQLLIDYTTGSCDAYVSVDNLVIETLSGNVAIDIPVTGTESATVDSQLTHGILSSKSATAERKLSPIMGGMKTAGGAVAGARLAGPGGAVGGAGVGLMSAAKSGFDSKIASTAADYELTHTQTPLRVLSACSPVGGWAIDFNCRLIITYPTGKVISTTNPPSLVKSELEKYGHINGFTTIDNATMRKYHGGLVVANTIDLSGISATEAEKELIISAVKEGCYI